MQQNAKASRNGGIDGLRALCIVAILLYHLNLPWVPSGHMGVVVFLVLSGYFATTAITRALEKDSRPAILHLLRTWGRRLLRIVPSVVALVAITGTMCAVGNHVLLTKMKPDILPSLGFYLNWSYIVSGVSYFDLIGGTSPLLHLWYLGVDLQFFLAWTLVLCVLRKVKKPITRKIALVLAIASGVLMAYLHVPGADPSRIYYGTDTRAFSLLLGSWLALAFPLGESPQFLTRLWVKPATKGEHVQTAEERTTMASHLIGIATLAAMIAAMTLIHADSDIWYRGGMFGFSVLATIFLATLLTPNSLLGTLLGLAPLRLLGARAFALYLWHYPIFQIMGANKSTTEWWMRLAAVGVSLIAAELSLRLIERPFGPQGTKPKETEEESGETRKGTFLNGRPKLAIVFSTLVVGIAGAYTYRALAITPDETLVPQEMLVSTGSAANQAMDLSQKKPQDEAEQPKAATENPEAKDTQEDSRQSTKPKNEEAEAGPVTVTDRTILHAPATETAKNIVDPVLIGDSVPGDAGDEFVPSGLGWESRLPDGVVDTYIGRRPDQSLEVLQGYLDQGVVGKSVVMACFSNSTPSPETLDAMARAVGSDRQLYLVGTVNPDGFQDEANENLKQAAGSYDNVHYVDWPAVLDGHLEEYLWADETHLRPEGAAVYVDMIVRAIAQGMVDAGGTTTEA